MIFNKLSKIPFTTWLGVVSVIGFGVIFINSVFNKDITPWGDSLLFLIIGFALFLTGGARFFRYFENGLTPSEINRIVTVAIGFSSMVVGVLIAPFFNINLVVVNGVKAVIAMIAMIVIVLEIIGDNK
jgi:peptidoglycan/LPS O-acetylase OafA/YrhL